MTERSERFRRRNRLRRSSEFRRVSEAGNRRAGTHLIVLQARTPATDAESPRIGLTVSRKVGGAVVRNRVKRRLREWFRRSKDRFEPASETVVIARASAAGASYHELAAELGRLLEPGRRRG